MQNVTAPDTSIHRAAECATSVLIWQLVLSHWTRFSPQETWTASIFGNPVAPGDGPRLDRPTRHALALGLRPESQRHSERQFALLRGLIVLQLRLLSASVPAAPDADTPHPASDLYRTALQCYMAIRSGLQRALLEDRARHELMQRRMLAAGLALTQPTPVQRWEGEWGGMLDGQDVQRVLPLVPWTFP